MERILEAGSKGVTTRLPLSAYRSRPQVIPEPPRRSMRGTPWSAYHGGQWLSFDSPHGYLAILSEKRYSSVILCSERTSSSGAWPALTDRCRGAE